MSVYVLHVTFVTRLLEKGNIVKAIRNYFTFNRRLPLLRRIFEEDMSFRNVELFTGISPLIYQFGFGFTEEKIVFFRKRNYLAHGGRSIIPKHLYAFATIYSNNPEKLKRQGERLIGMVDGLRDKYPILKSIFVYPEIRKAKSVNTSEWDNEAYALYKSGVREKNIKLPKD